MRAKCAFTDLTQEIMGDMQALQDALNREAIVERPKKSKFEQLKFDQVTTQATYKGKTGGKGFGKRQGGKGWSDDRRWTPYYNRRSSWHDSECDTQQNRWWSQGSRNSRVTSWWGEMQEQKD